jgi:hypothetical protein
MRGGAKHYARLGLGFFAVRRRTNRIGRNGNEIT